MTVDNCGRQVTFDKRPERVLAIDPEAATLLAEAGAADRISSYAGFTADVPFGKGDRAVKAAQQLGNTADLSLEAIIGARPDVVIGYGAKYIESLAANGIPMLFVSGYCEDEGFPLPGDPSVFDLINRDIETYGALFGTRDTATRSVADLRERVARAQEQTRNRPQTPTAALYMYEPLAAYGNNAVVHEQLSILGLKNVFADTKRALLRAHRRGDHRAQPRAGDRAVHPEQSKLPTPQSVIQELQSRQELAGITAIRDNTIIPFLYYYKRSRATRRRGYRAAGQADRRQELSVAPRRR